MTFQVVSDLHFELHEDHGTKFVDQMDPTGVDVLVLAGDITSVRFFTQAQELFKRLAAKYPKILYVPGNHELWGMSPAEALSVIGNVSEGISNMTVLNNQVVVINGQRVLGGPMWFPQWSPLHDYAATQMNDFHQIVDFRPWVVAENAKFQTFIKQNLKTGDVVLTHYLPSMKSVAPRYKGSATNAFFVTEMDQLIIDRKPALWIHGHTHCSFDYQLSSTRIVCNPFGYPWESNSGYKTKLLIPIE